MEFSVTWFYSMEGNVVRFCAWNVSGGDGGGGGSTTAAADDDSDEASSFHVQHDVHERSTLHADVDMCLRLYRQNNINNSLHFILADAASNERNKLHDI